ncbi:diguanylate cyclase [Lacimicrobium alkaliphilum]|nr:diguanylate cyclase [Lacimicrobium alkaliphilum]
MAENPSDSVEDKLRLLSQRFSHRTARELDDLRHKIGQSDEQHGDWELLEYLHQVLHRLTGSAGTFGLQQFSHQSRTLEQLVKGLLQQPHNKGDKWPAIYSELQHRILPELKDLDRLLGDSAPKSAAISERQNHDNEDALLVLVEHQGAFYTSLQEELKHYGFALMSVASCAEFSQKLSRIPTSVIMIAHVSQAQACIEIRRLLQQQTPQRSISIVCFGSCPEFDSRYKIAALGIDGLFSEATNATEVAEYLQRLQTERLEASGGKVLIVDDDVDLLEHYRLTLTAAGMTVKTLGTPEAIFSVLSEFKPDILLLDVHMGAYSGPTLARMIRFQPQWLSLPIIYLSAEQDKSEQLKALADGADEFISKPISDSELKETVRTRCFRARQLANLLARDSLTGLLKHSLIKQEMANEYARCRRVGEQAAVVMLDLDHFKRVNDDYGHGTGDTVIKALANLLTHRLRKTDKIGRYGGEEFAIVMPQCDLTQAEQILEQIRLHFSGLVFQSGRNEFHVTLSAGIALLNDYEDPESALEAADQALYQRKQLGRNGVSLALAGAAKGEQQ